jgi:thioredoxin 1
MKEIQNKADFDLLISQDKPLLLDFYADWCGPCQAMLPSIEKLAEEHNESFNIVKVNVDKNPELAAQFQVRSIPALFFMQSGKVVEHLNELRPASELELKIEHFKSQQTSLN